MKEIRNANGKLICRLDEKKAMIEIVHKGVKTQIHFTPNGKVEIVDIDEAKINRIERTSCI